MRCTTIVVCRKNLFKVSPHDGPIIKVYCKLTSSSRQILSKLYSKYLRKIPLFSDCEDSVIRAFCTQLQPIVCPSDQYIIFQVGCLLFKFNRHTGKVTQTYEINFVTGGSRQGDVYIVPGKCHYWGERQRGGGSRARLLLRRNVITDKPEGKVSHWTFLIVPHSTNLQFQRTASIKSTCFCDLLELTKVGMVFPILTVDNNSSSLYRL